MAWFLWNALDFVILCVHQPWPRGSEMATGGSQGSIFPGSCGGRGRWEPSFAPTIEQSSWASLWLPQIITHLPLHCARRKLWLASSNQVLTLELGVILIPPRQYRYWHGKQCPPQARMEGRADGKTLTNQRTTQGHGTCELGRRGRE